MPQRPFSRSQVFLIPPSLDDWLPADHPARFVAAVLDGLDAAAWRRLGIERHAERVGAPRYAPEGLLGIWVYGFMSGIRSTRGLEAACRDQIPFRWLGGNQTPDHNTLARFYQTHAKGMRELFKQTVTIAVETGLVDWALQAVDGTKIAANAAVERSLTEAQLALLLARTEAAIAQLDDQQVSGADDGPPSLPPGMRNAKTQRTRIAQALGELRASGPAKRNLTDPDALLMKTRRGIVPAYNAQAVVAAVAMADGEPSGRVIVATTVTTAPTDHGQLAPMIAEATEGTGRQAELTVADTGYYRASTLAECAELGAVVAVPEQIDRTPAHQAVYPQSAFAYDEASDVFGCPAGQTLSFRGITANPGGGPMRRYGADSAVCRDCPLRSACTRARSQGRTLKVSVHAMTAAAHRTWMATEAARTASRMRRAVIEPVFGILKERFGGRRFLRRGLVKVQSEWQLLAAAFNLRTLWRRWRVAPETIAWG